MSYIVDRRDNSKNKNAVNRQRFLDRYKKHIKKSVEDAIKNRNITDMKKGKKVSIPESDLEEPVFHHGSGGRRKSVHPGNREFDEGDKITRPPSGGSGDGNKASGEGEGEDDFFFTLSQEEFLNYLFENLELPNLAKRHLTGADSYKHKHGGYTTDGPAARLSIVRSFKQSKLRRNALIGRDKKRLAYLKEQLRLWTLDYNTAYILNEEIEELEKKIKKTPFLDPNDLRYKLSIKQPVPIHQAVMFCLMDVSGSMGQKEKSLAKKFYLLLYLFLTQHYERVDIVWIRYHTVAKEVDEHEFFNSRETGGTVVSSSLKLMQKILKDRYPVEKWNLYAAMASDGDNFAQDVDLTKECVEEVLPLLQYFAYVEISAKPKNMWESFSDITGKTFARQRLNDDKDIYPVFQELFKKHEA